MTIERIFTSAARWLLAVSLPVACALEDDVPQDSRMAAYDPEQWGETGGDEDDPVDTDDEPGVFDLPPDAFDDCEIIFGPLQICEMCWRGQPGDEDYLLRFKCSPIFADDGFTPDDDPEEPEDP